MHDENYVTTLLIFLSNFVKLDLNSWYTHMKNACPFFTAYVHNLVIRLFSILHAEKCIPQDIVVIRHQLLVCVSQSR